jgi:hypothetical protein
VFSESVRTSRCRIRPAEAAHEKQVSTGTMSVNG